MTDTKQKTNDERLADFVGSGRLSTGIPDALCKCGPKERQAGLRDYILERVDASKTASLPAVATAARRLGEFDEFRLPDDVPPVGRNRARVMAAIWQAALKKDEAEAWKTLASLTWELPLADFFVNGKYTTKLVKAFRPDLVNDIADAVNWLKAMLELAPQVSCKTCPVAKLPREQIKEDLPLPCRLGREELPGTCVYGMADDDDLYVPVPLSWRSLTGVWAQHGQFAVTEFVHLVGGWNQMREAKDGQPPDGMRPEQPEEKPVKPTKPKPRRVPKGELIQAGIADYMEHHGAMMDDHPLATPCATCVHKLKKSPVEDKEVPHCTWARLEVDQAWYALKPVKVLGRPIPRCRQYKPDGSLVKRVPEFGGEGTMPREWILAQIGFLVQKTNERCSHAMSPTALEFLAGRPEETAKAHGEWVLDKIRKAGKRLSDEQLWTLLIWALADYKRLHNRLAVGSEPEEFLLPLSGDGTRFGAFVQITWQEARESVESDS